MYRMLTFIPRNDGLSYEEFRTVYEEEHVPLILSLGIRPKVYKRHYIKREAPLIGTPTAIQAVDFDVVTEVGFDSKEECWGTIDVVRNSQQVKDSEAKFQKSEGVRIYEVETRVTGENSPEDLAAKGITNPWTIIEFAKKKADISLEAYRDHYENEHVPILLDSSPKGYSFRRMYLDGSKDIRGDSAESASPLPYNSVLLATFPGESGFQVKVMGKPDGDGGNLARIYEDDEKFMDRSVKILYAAEERITFDV